MSYSLDRRRRLIRLFHNVIGHGHLNVLQSVPHKVTEHKVAIYNAARSRGVSMRPAGRAAGVI